MYVCASVCVCVCVCRRLACRNTPGMSILMRGNTSRVQGPLALPVATTSYTHRHTHAHTAHTYLHTHTPLESDGARAS